MMNNTNGFIIAQLLIFGMVATQWYILMLASTTKLNMVELVSLRVGFTIYTGWVTAASIIGVCFFLVSVGMTEPNAGFSNTAWCIIILYVALIIYILASFRERNPLYAGVYIWVLLAIRSERVDTPSIQTNCIVCIVLTAIAVAGITAFSMMERTKGTL